MPLLFAHTPAVPATQAQQTRTTQQRERVPFKVGPIGLQANAGGRVGTGGVGAWDHRRRTQWWHEPHPF
jgi:hypothetical protein